MNVRRRINFVSDHNGHMIKLYAGSIADSSSDSHESDDESDRSDGLELMERSTDKA